MIFADRLCKELKANNFTHCFFLAGGNNMHLLNSARKYFNMVPFVHEVGACIAGEYFNESNFRLNNKNRCFVLVTAGPGLTNTITGIAGAFLESRELLIIGGQVKTSDLKRGGIRQRGIQEVDGVSIVKSITKASKRLNRRDKDFKLNEFLNIAKSQRKGPVFLEIPLDVQAMECSPEFSPTPSNKIDKLPSNSKKIRQFLNNAERPVLLLGGGTNTSEIKNFDTKINNLGIPVQTTWNGINCISSDNKFYFGRPNTWGQRFANLILQQSDLIFAVGTRLGLQQTGFNWKKFAPNAKIIHVDIDERELNKGHPKTDLKLNKDANEFLKELFQIRLTSQNKPWVNYCRSIKSHFPLIEKNITNEGFVSPFKFIDLLSTSLNKNDIFIPCSSGGAFTSSMQVFRRKAGQLVITNKALASMGYGLSGAIGASIANRGKSVTLVEGDGGFIQNLQELGTVDINRLNINIIIFYDNGYASIRMTQKNYFGGDYLGCDGKTGLGMPNFKKLSEAYNLDFYKIAPKNMTKTYLSKILHNGNPKMILVPIDPEQTYYPKINSKVKKGGGMESSPLDDMFPPLNINDNITFKRFLKNE